MTKKKIEWYRISTEKWNGNKSIDNFKCKITKQTFYHFVLNSTFIGIIQIRIEMAVSHCLVRNYKSISSFTLSASNTPFTYRVYWYYVTWTFLKLVRKIPLKTVELMRSQEIELGFEKLKSLNTVLLLNENIFIHDPSTRSISKY